MWIICSGVYLFTIQRISGSLCDCNDRCHYLRSDSVCNENEDWLYLHGRFDLDLLNCTPHDLHVRIIVYFLWILVLASVRSMCRAFWNIFDIWCITCYGKRILCPWVRWLYSWSSNYLCWYNWYIHWVTEDFWSSWWLSKTSYRRTKMSKLTIIFLLMIHPL